MITATKNNISNIKGISMDSYLSEYDKSALAECDFEYLESQERFIHPTEDLLIQIIEYYDTITKDDEKLRYEYYYNIVDVYYHDITDKVLVRIAGSYMFDEEYYGEFVYNGLLGSCFEAYKKAVEMVKDINTISDSHIWDLMSSIELRKLKVFIHHFGKEQLLARLYDICDYYSDSDYEERYGDYERKVITKLIGRVKRCKE